MNSLHSRIHANLPAFIDMRLARCLSTTSAAARSSRPANRAPFSTAAPAGEAAAAAAAAASSARSAHTAHTARSPPAKAFRPCTLSGMQTTGIPHLGNYLGALRNWVSLQSPPPPPPPTDADADAQQADALVAAKPAPPPHVLYMLADLHALTVRQEPERLRTAVFDLTCALLAVGIDPARAVLFRQSFVPQHAELAWLLFCRTPVSWVSRMHQWKAKLQMMGSAADAGDTDDGELDDGDVSRELNTGLLSYPILQAADILLYRATQVPVGEDQAQHLNLTAMIARSFNSHYKRHVFPIPQSVIPSSTAKRIMSLKNPTSKMSKSDPVEHSRINLDDSPDTIASKIRRATTDSIQGISYDPVGRPGVTNLLRIHMALDKLGDPSASVGGTTFWEKLREDEMMQLVAERFGSMDNKAFKQLVTDTVVAHVSPIRNEIVRLRAEKAYVLGVLKEGEQRAAAIAERTMKDVRRTVGLQ
ncbi:hypothetical protein BC831DRAFT_421787 [Entophlyctis helioformis]|nr:hypothetical protein BC831DRAFT_421787 [Entophlyctis helioformis]